MLINHELASFIVSPIMIILGSCDAALMPEIGRAVGAFVHDDGSRVDLAVSEWQWPGTVANARENGRLSVTFARPSDYVSYQMKGQVAVMPATREHRALAKRYAERMAATLEELGLENRVVTPWLVGRNLVTLRLSVQEVFVQTPGAQAGQLVERQP